MHYLKDAQSISILGVRVLINTLTHEADGSATMRLTVEGRPGGIDFDFPTTPESLLAEIANPLIITRHAGLVDFLIDICPCLGTIQVLAHATPADVMGRVCIGVLPPHLAALALLQVEIPLDFSDPALRGSELTAAGVAAIAGSPRFYRVMGV